MVRKYLISIILLLLSHVAYGQIDDNDTITHYQSDNTRSFLWYPDEFPIYDKNFPKGDLKLHEFVKENLQYPETAKTDKVEGAVIVRFWIDTTGITTEHKIFQSVREDLDNEALRVAKLIKFDVPAMHNGKPVGMWYNFPFKFFLDKDRNNGVKSKKKVPK